MDVHGLQPTTGPHTSQSMRQRTAVHQPVILDGTPCQRPVVVGMYIVYRMGPPSYKLVYKPI